MCTCANLRKAARVVTQAYDSTLKSVGLTATQFTILAMLCARGRMPLSRLANELVMDRTSLTRTLRPLLEKGFIRIEAGADRRVREVCLTASGQDRMDAAYPVWREAQLRFIHSFGRGRWRGMIDDLAATVAAVRNG